MFYPQHCAAGPDPDIFASPVVAYLKQDNKPHKDLVDMVTSHFDTFETMIRMVSGNDFLLDTVTESIRSGRTESAVEAEALLKAYDS